MYRSKLLDREFKRKHVPVVHEVPRSDLLYVVKSNMHLSSRHKNFKGQLISAVQGGGIGQQYREGGLVSSTGRGDW